MTTLGKKLANFTAEMRRPGISHGDRVVHVAGRSLRTLGLAPRVDVTRRIIVEISTPPPPPRGFADLVVRRGNEGDIGGLCAIVGEDPAVLRRRFSRGDLVYVGQLEDQLICHTWFHAGPTPFEEERLACASWALDATTFWSFDAMTRADFRSTGVFVKLFQLALREVFELHGARRVHGFIYHNNSASLALHARLGFSAIGTVTTVVFPGVKWLRWKGSGRARHWVLPRGSDFALQLPPP
jgi:RimJ/RimL family protein N-acetyltransferase